VKTLVGDATGPVGATTPVAALRPGRRRDPGTMRLLILVLCLWFPAAAGEAPRTGTFQLTFTERHPESAYERMRIRYGWGAAEPDGAYDLSQEAFDVHVPPAYDGSQPYGLIVYTNAGKGGNANAYRELMARHRLIWIGAANVPNDRNVVPRWGLALDAAWNMPKRYRIDPRRIYASGTSGGGRCASMVAPTFADVFSGAIYLIGCNEPVFPPEAAVGRPIKALAMANRYALVTGSGDFNKPGTQEVHALMVKLGFRHATYLEQPGLGHANPSPEWFEKAIIAVDGPLAAEAQALVAQAGGLEARKPAEACRMYRQVIDGYPSASVAVAAATARFAALAPAQDALLRQELATLTAAPGGGSGEKLRAFAAKAVGFPCHAEARTAADAIGVRELEPLLAQGAGAKTGLERFLTTWEGYPCAERALGAYDALAAKALEPLQAQTPAQRGRPLLKLLKDYRPCPARERAAALLDGDLDSELTKILAIEKPAQRGPKLVAFVKAWPGTAAAAKAEAAARALAAAAK
jgi:hypothetical protein